MDPHDGDQEGRLEGDHDDATYTDAEGDLRYHPHHDDWVDNTWYDADGVNRGRHIVYRDVTRPTPVPNVPWLLMEPIAHESRRRSWVRFLKNLALLIYKICMYAINCVYLCWVFVLFRNL